MFYKIQALIYRNNELTAVDVLIEMCLFIQALPDWSEKPDRWFIANPASKILAVENNHITQEAINLIDSIIKSNEDISIVLAGQDEDNSILTIWYKNTPSISKKRYTLSFTMKSLKEKNGSEVFLGFIKNIIVFPFWDFKYLLLDTEQYKRKQRSVFLDRLSVGWMLYFPIKLNKADIPSALSVINVDNFLGAIVISKNTFNGREPFDIACANNVEIELASNGFLPLIKGL